MPHLLLLILVLTAHTLPVQADATPQLHIDPDRITVSGMSSGAQMAHQLHLAWSDLFSGAAMLAGGPFGCADGSVRNALGRCLGKPDTEIPLDELLRSIRSAAQDGRLASLENLADDPVWIFHGSLDSAVPVSVNDALVSLYEELLSTENLQVITDVPAAHTFPAKGAGSACDTMASPFVGDCDYDAAGMLLQHLYPGLVSPGSKTEAELTPVPLPGAEQALLDESAFLYIPPNCTSGERSCGLHLVLHGCAQSASQVGTAFIEQSGYLRWAAANDLVLAFPQAKASMPNALACWDWWGYSGENYRWRQGTQMGVLVNWVKQLANINDR